MLHQTARSPSPRAVVPENQAPAAAHSNALLLFLTSRANATATARPMPESPPVMRATCKKSRRASSNKDESTSPKRDKDDINRCSGAAAVAAVTAMAGRHTLPSSKPEPRCLSTVGAGFIFISFSTPGCSWCSRVSMPERCLTAGGDRTL